MKFVNDRQRKAVMARLGKYGSIKFSSYPGVPNMTDEEVEKLLFDILPPDEAAKALRRLKERKVVGEITRGADERSEDYVSKGDWDHDKYSKRGNDSEYEETIDGYECRHCGAEFSTKASAKVHVSMCDDKESDDDKDSSDDFFNGDDGLI